MRNNLVVVALGVLALAGAVWASDDLLVKPIVDSGEEVAVIFIQGAGIGTDQYTALAGNLQEAAKDYGIRLWVALPHATLDVANPLTVGSAIETGFTLLSDNGYPGPKNVFLAGHSLGGNMLQSYAASHADNFVGVALYGAALSRTYRQPVGNNFPLPTLTLSGELDGLFRVTRVVEDFYRDVLLTTDEIDVEKAVTNPAIVVEGMSHFQFCTGEAPLLVKARDLKPEISDEVAKTAIAEATAAFLSYTTKKDANSKNKLKALAKSTYAFAKPIIAAYEYEGSRDFNRMQQKGGPFENCPKGGCKGGGSAWAVVAQEYIADLDTLKDEGFRLNVTNDYVELSALPPFGEFHLPAISKSEEDPQSLLLTTYTQGYWETLDSLDTGFVSTSAWELGTKMMSRQCVQVRGAGKDDTPFSVDDPSFCAEINKKAYMWAYDNAGEKTQQRFSSIGEKYVFGDDESKSGGPFWINARMKYEQVAVAGETVTKVTAAMIKTSKDFIRIPGLPDPSCYHYCKLLSPARAMEWIYVDSLRLRGALSSNE